MSRFILEYKLKQQTPMIHFQYDEEGATLRASEVKPKLDRFLITKLGKGNYGDGLKVAEKNKWLLGEHNSLNYKMRIVAPIGEQPQITVVNGKMFFANQGVHSVEDKKRTVLYEEGFTKIEIIVGILKENRDNLKDFIEEYIRSFFAVTNFGLRQSKGYGSFIVVNNDDSMPTPIQYAALLPADRTWMIDLGKQDVFKGCNQVGIFDRYSVDAFWIYSLMKSGINKPKYNRGYIFQYMHSKNTGNEKAYIKEKYPFVAQSGSNLSRLYHANNNNSSMYVRGLLGIAEFYEFDLITQDHELKKIYIKGKNVERHHSPLTFRYYNNILYWILEDIPQKLLNESFQFSQDGKYKYDECPDKNIIKTPSNFDLIDFMRNFEKYFNGDKSNVAKQIISDADKKAIRSYFFADEDVKELKKKQKQLNQQLTSQQKKDNKQEQREYRRNQIEQYNKLAVLKIIKL